MNVIYVKYAKQQVMNGLNDESSMPNAKNDEWMQRILTYTKLNA